MVHDLGPGPVRAHDLLHDLLGELAAAQWAVEDAVSVVDGGLPVDLVHYLASTARLDAAVAAWNRRAAPHPVATPG
ncbi:hypothetical protein M1843_19400 [Isoptericola sp. 4D.3]|jgi:hypothetical protein|uniref:Uncharacterized protein n=1 Tax=Isoptericola peretonis TaxID=2918523 RepID=A0ABT0J8U2_9MICO|nr:hypothetical protein [Isoptericola sp. 4D.3]